jgi:hypothetical protein
MAESITVQLPDDLAHLAREAARRDGRSLEDILVAWLVQAAQEAGPAIVTPYGNEDAAQVLLDALRAAPAAPSSNPHP